MRLIFYWLMVFATLPLFFGCRETVKKQEPGRDVAVKIQSKKTSDSLTARQLLDSLVNDSVFRNSGIGILVSEVTSHSGHVMVACNPDLSLVPASVLKIFTTATALEILGGSKSFGTHLQYSGQVEGRILHGNLYIRGGGDPTFTIERSFNRWIEALAALGIDTVEGNIIGDARIFGRFPIPSTWTWGELNSSYAAPPSGLTINDNVYEVKSRLKNERGQAMAGDPLQAYLAHFLFHNRVTESGNGSGDIYVTGNPFDTEKYLEGTVAKGVKDFSVFGAMPDPPLAAATVFHQRLESKGIHVTGQPYNYSNIRDTAVLRTLTDQRTQIGSGFSPGVATLVHTANQESNNLYAEHLIKHIGLNRFHNGSDEAGARAIAEFWKTKGMDTGGLYLFDGCGISRYNGVTARQLVFVLHAMQRSAYAEVFYNSLPLAGVTGTLRNAFRDSPGEGHLRAKTGTMSRVKSLAGYMHTRSNRTFIFAILLNNFSAPQSDIRQKVEKFLNGLILL